MRLQPSGRAASDRKTSIRSRGFQHTCLNFVHLFFVSSESMPKRTQLREVEIYVQDGVTVKVVDEPQVVRLVPEEKTAETTSAIGPTGTSPVVEAGEETESVVATEWHLLDGSGESTAEAKFESLAVRSFVQQWSSVMETNFS